MEDNITIFVDNVGRMIVGKVDDDKTNKTTLAVTNPSIVQIQPDQQTGNISVQFLPYIFSEFVAKDVRNKVTWSFNKATIVTSDNIELDERVVQQYKQIVENAPVATAAPAEEPEVIKLFDDE